MGRVVTHIYKIIFKEFSWGSIAKATGAIRVVAFVVLCLQICRRCNGALVKIVSFGVGCWVVPSIGRVVGFGCDDVGLNVYEFE